MDSNKYHISVGVIRNCRREVLIAKRPADVHQGGLWEFPGGKQEINESKIQALDRELKEELGVTVVSCRPLIKLHYLYPDNFVELDVWLINEWKGEPYGRESQEVKWVAINELEKSEFLPANEAIIRALRLPELYMISPGPGKSTENYLDNIDCCTRAGASLLQLRCNEDLYESCPELIHETRSICGTNGTKLLLNCNPATAVSFNADGVHLNSARLLQLNNRPLNDNYLVSASCHNQMEVEHAARINIDFVVISPVKHTSSHPEATPLGWDEFARLTEISNIPVFALGGMTPDLLPTAWQYGAQGLAILGGIWNAGNPAEVVEACAGYKY